MEKQIQELWNQRAQALLVEYKARMEAENAAKVITNLNAQISALTKAAKALEESQGSAETGDDK